MITRLKNDYYRDGFYKVVFTLGLIVFAIILLLIASLYLHFSKPKPVSFAVGHEWRVLAPVPVDQPYLSTADLVQWVSSAISTVFNYDFLHYNSQLSNAAQYFTPSGWKRFGDLLNGYVNYSNLSNGKQFVRAVPTGAPFILNQGILQNKYAWWVQMPVTLKYVSYNSKVKNDLVLQVLVVRIPTDNNLDGVAIDNVIVSKSSGNVTEG